MQKPVLATETTVGATRGSLAVIFLTVFIDLLGFAMVIPLLPIYAEQFQADESGAVIGLLMASFSAMQFLFAPLWGRISDRIGRRPVLLIGLAGAALFYALFGVATLYSSIVGLFASRIGAGIACATIPVAQAYIADTTTKENRAKGMALIGAAFGIGFCFGPLLGAAAIFWSANVATSPWPGFVAAGLSGFAFLLALAILPESLHPDSFSAGKKIFDGGAWRDALSTPSIGGLLLASFVSVLSFGGFETTLSLLLKNEEVGYNFDLTKILFFFSYIGLVLSLVQGGLVRRLSGKLSEGTMATTGVVLSLIGFACIFLAAHYRHFYGLMLATGIEVGGFAFVTPSLQALISRRSDPAKQGSIAGVSQSVSALARIAGPVFAMLLFKKSVLLPYIVSTALMVLAVLVLRVALNRGKDYGSSLSE
jgi:MFS transporter, DHA1 family, tetracycline resistance protein